jgi:hypothetical protein
VFLGRSVLGEIVDDEPELLALVLELADELVDVGLVSTRG